MLHLIALLPHSSILNKENAYPVQQDVWNAVTAILAFNAMLTFILFLQQQPFAQKNVVMVKDMSTNVMMEEIMMEMVAVLIVKSNLDIHAEVDHHQVKITVQV